MEAQGDDTPLVAEEGPPTLTRLRRPMPDPVLVHGRLADLMSEQGDNRDQQQHRPECNKTVSVPLHARTGALFDRPGPLDRGPFLDRTTNRFGRSFNLLLKQIRRCGCVGLQDRPIHLSVLGPGDHREEQCENDRNGTDGGRVLAPHPERGTFDREIAMFRSAFRNPHSAFPSGRLEVPPEV